MRVLTLFTLLAMVAVAPLLAQPSETTSVLIPAFNETIPFAKVDVAAIKVAADTSIERFQKDLATIRAIPKGSHNRENTLLALDDAYHRLYSVFSPVYLLGDTSPNPALREECFTQRTRIQEQMTGLSLDKGIFDALSALQEGPEKAKLKTYEQRLLNNLLRDYRNSGLALPTSELEKLRALRGQITDLENTFNRNIADFQDALVLTEAEMAGMDEAYKKERRQADGTYKIELDSPSYSAFMRSADNAEARKKLYFKFFNRAAEKNMAVLKDLLDLRKRQATLLGYKSFADLQLASKLANTSANALAFEEDLAAKVKPKTKQEYAQLLETKRNHLGPQETRIESWDLSYYGERLMREKYQVDNREVREYFELNRVRDGLFSITQALMGVTFKQVADPSVWHEDVTAYEVFDQDKVIGRFYLDLYPRPNKYGHAACFPILQGKQTKAGYQIPTAALVCNFPKPSAEQGALMTHAEVETFFHEFGHVLHHMLTTAELSQQSGSNVAPDFVEAPSQIFENWAWEYVALEKFATHYKTGQVLPKGLFEKMNAARNAMSGIGVEYQIFLGLLDLAYHHQYDPNSKESLIEIAYNIEDKTRMFPPVRGTHFPASFGHLTGYAANYYGYMYSSVFAQDMFSVFAKEGVLNEKTGRRYRDIILGLGDTEDPRALMTRFIGREPNNQAFIKSLGL